MPYRVTIIDRACSRAGGGGVAGAVRDAGASSCAKAPRDSRREAASSFMSGSVTRERGRNGSARNTQRSLRRAVSKGGSPGARRGSAIGSLGSRRSGATPAQIGSA